MKKFFAFAALCCVPGKEVLSQTFNLSIHGGLYANSKPYKSDAFKPATSLCSSVEIGGNIHGWGIDAGVMISQPQMQVDYNKLKFANQSENILPTGETFGSDKYYMAKPLYTILFSPYRQFNFNRIKMRVGLDGGLSSGTSYAVSSGSIRVASYDDMAKKAKGYNVGVNSSVALRIVSHLYVDIKLQYDYVKLNYPQSQYFDFTAFSGMLGLRYSTSK